MLFLKVVIFCLYTVLTVINGENKVTPISLGNEGTISKLKEPMGQIGSSPATISPPASFKNSEDSYIVRFTNVGDGQVMTVDGDQAVPHLNISARAWNKSDSQQWVLVARGDVYLILPKIQHREWANFKRRTSQRGSDNLPAVTVVAGIDVMNGRINQQVLHGRSNQHWEFKDAKDGRVLISSPARIKCIAEKYPEKEDPSLLQRTKNKIKGVFGVSTKKPEVSLEPRELIAVDCDDQDTHQLWRIEPVPTK